MLRGFLRSFSSKFGTGNTGSSWVATLTFAVAVLLALTPSANAAPEAAHFSGALITAGSGFTAPAGVAVDSKGDVFVANSGFGGGVYEILAVNGLVSTSSSVISVGGGYSYPLGVAVDSKGDVFVADGFNGGNSHIYEVVADSNGNVSGSSQVNTLASIGSTAFSSVALDASGNVYTVRSSGQDLYMLQATGGVVPNNSTPVLLATGFSDPSGVAVDGSGNIYVSDYYHNAVEEIPAGSTFPVTVGSSNYLPAPSGGWGGPTGVALDASGDLFVTTHTGQSVYEIVASGGAVSSSSAINRVLYTYNYLQALAISTSGNIYIAIQNSSTITEDFVSAVNFGEVPVNTKSSTYTLNFTFDTDGATINAPIVLTQGATGKDFADATTGGCTEVHGASQPYALGATCSVDVTLKPAVSGTRYGTVELTDLGGNVLATAYLQGAGTGPQVAFLPATQSTLGSGGLNGAPAGIAVDGNGNIFVAQATDMLAEIPAGSSSATTLSKSIEGADGVAVDGAGNLFVAAENKHAVYEVMAAGGYTTVNQLATSFKFGYPYGIAVDGAGNLFVADAGNNAVYEIPAAGGYTTVTTLGSGFSEPHAVAVDAYDNVFVGDSGHSAVKEITAASNYATVKTLGGSSSQFSSFYGIAVDGNGNVFVPYWNGHGVIAEITAASGYTTINTLASGLPQIQNAAVDGKGNIYLLPYSPGSVLKLDLADAPTLNFASTPMDSTSSPQTVTVENIGNADLSFPAPATGDNPSIATGFTLDSSSGADCQLVASGASSPGTLAAGASCLLPVTFAPTSVASYNGSTLTISDDALNASAPNYTTQTITLNGTGTGTGAPQTITFTDSLPSEAIYNGVNLQYAISATGGGSGNAVTFSLDGASTPGIATLNGSTLTITGMGTVIIDAAQAAGGNYAAGSSSQSITTITDTPGGITPTFGGLQSAYEGTAFSEGLIALVTGTSGNPMSGVTVTFSAPSSGASAILSSLTAVTDQNGRATVTATANMTAGGPYQVTASYPNSGFAVFELTNLAPPTFTVTTLTDDATGTAANCTDQSQSGATPDATCSLRDAIAAAAAASTSTVTPTVNFASSLNLTASAPGDYNVTTGGTLNIAKNMNIVGPGANLLSIDGANSSGVATTRVFDIASGTVSISGLTITKGFGSNGENGGGGILNYGTLTITNCIFSGNATLDGGGGILNYYGTLTITNCIFSGNAASAGGGIFNFGIVTVTGSTFSGNAALAGGGIFGESGGRLTVTNSTFSGNSGSKGGGGIFNNEGALTVANSTFSGNSGGAPFGGAGVYNNGSPMVLANVLSPDAMAGGYTDNGGNVTSGNITLAPLGYYFGTTQTMPPLLGSVAICAGTAANATAAGLTTDQRGNPRSTTAYNTTACVDAGAVQTAYSLTFTASPSSSQKINVALTPAPVVQLNDLNPLTGKSAPIALSGAPITLAIYAGAISGGVPTVGTALNGVSTFSGVTVATPETGDYLIARAPVGPYSIEANSSDFNIAAMTLSPASGALTAGAYGAAYSQQFTASNGTAPYSYTATGMPPGLSISSATGVMSGTPTSIAGSPYTVVVTVTDAASNSVQQSYTLAVGSAASGISVSSSANPAFINNTVTYTAAVGFATAPSLTTIAGPTGTVTFYDGGTAITTCSAATLGAYNFTTNAALATCAVSYTSTTPATHAITATYTPGNSSFTGNSSGTFTEALADFTITAQNATLTMMPGASGQYTFTVSPVSPATTFPAVVNLTVSGLPTGYTGSFSPSATIAANAGAATVTLTIQTNASAQNSPNTGGRLASRLAGISLALLLLPFVGRMRKAGKRFSRMLPILLLLIAGMAAAVGLSGCGSNTGFFGQAQQSYPVTVTATSGTLSRTSNVTLTVE